MALITGKRHVGANKSEASHCRMIKLGAGSTGSRVALLTGIWKPRGHVVRIFGTVEVVLVTTEAGRRCPFELATHVTGGAVQAGMSPGQSKAGEAVIEFCSQPSVHGCVALLTSGWKSERP